MTEQAKLTILAANLIDTMYKKNMAALQIIEAQQLIEFLEEHCEHVFCQNCGKFFDLSATDKNCSECGAEYENEN